MTVLGPHGLSEGYFHVHAYGCRDIGMPRYEGTEKDWQVDGIADMKALVIALFDNIIDEGTGNWEDYAGDVTVFPCTGLN